MASSRIIDTWRPGLVLVVLGVLALALCGSPRTTAVSSSSHPPARVTIRIEDADHVNEAFELAGAGGEFREVQHNRLTRATPAG